MSMRNFKALALVAVGAAAAFPVSAQAACIDYAPPPPGSSISITISDPVGITVTIGDGSSNALLVETVFQSRTLEFFTGQNGSGRLDINDQTTGETKCSEELDENSQYSVDADAEVPVQKVSVTPPEQTSGNQNVGGKILTTTAVTTAIVAPVVIAKQGDKQASP